MTTFLAVTAAGFVAFCSLRPLDESGTLGEPILPTGTICGSAAVIAIVCARTFG